MPFIKVYQTLPVLLFCVFVVASPAESKSEERQAKLAKKTHLEPPPSVAEENNEKVRGLEEDLKKQIEIIRAVNNDKEFSFIFSSRYGEVETELQAKLNTLRELAKTAVFPDSTIMTLINIYSGAPLSVYTQELLSYTLKTSSGRTVFPMQAGAKIWRLILNHSVLLVVKRPLMQTVKEQIQNHSRFLIKIQALNDILSDKNKTVEIRTEALHTMQAYAEKQPLISASVLLLGKIIQDRKNPEQFRKVAVETLAEGIKDHLLPKEKWEIFTKIIKDKTESRFIRSSLMLVFMESAKHQPLPDFVLRSLQQVIYNKKELPVVKRSAQQAFISIVESSDLKPPAGLEILKHIVHNSKNLTHIREAAGRAIMSNYSSDIKKQPATKVRRLWDFVKFRCYLAF